MDDALDQLTKTFSTYDKTADDTVTKINSSLIAVGAVLLGVLFLMEMMSWYRYLKAQGGEITWKLFLEAAIKYVIAYFLVYQSGAILDAILWFTNGITKTLGANLEGNVFEGVELTKGNWIVRAVIDILQKLVGAATILSVRVLVLLRYVELYLGKAIAPIIVAFFMNDSTRSIATNFLKRFGAVALQGAIIVILMLIFQAFNVTDTLNMENSDWLEDFAAGFSYIGKCAVFMILLFGSQRTAKSLLQAN